MIERFEERAAIHQRAQPVETHGIEPLENVSVLPMLWGAAVFLHKSLNFLEAGDDAFLKGRATALLLRLREVVEFGAQFVEVEVTHSGPHP
jgi:hypothetical protein